MLVFYKEKTMNFNFLSIEEYIFFAQTCTSQKFIRTKKIGLEYVSFDQINLDYNLKKLHNLELSIL